MKLQPTTLFGLTLSLLLAGTGVARAENHQDYIDDGLELIDVELEEKGYDAPGIEALEPGLEPVFIEPAMFEPDDLRGASFKDGATNDGTGPLIGTNYIRLYISHDHVNAGSNTDYIYVRFGMESGDGDGSSAYQFRLYGMRDGSDYSFPSGYMLTWDLEGRRDFFEGMPQHHWDQISFKTPSGDGMLIYRAVVVHSGQEILDWRADRWLDYPDYTTLGCAAKITERKLEHVGNSDHAAIHFGALDIGKTNGYKYGTGRLFCSEFASWALHMEGFMTPYGNIGTDNMKAWFSARGRLYTRSQVKAKTYVPKQGDYLSINGGGHSCLFLEWVDDPSDPITDATRFKTLDGNSGQTVKVVTRTVGVIDRVGKAQ